MSAKKPEWTNSQLTALRRRGNTIVSAAAGSGKTTVMTEKIVRLLRGGARLQQMLVVTFTNAAANQLREKIRESLADCAAEGDRDTARHMSDLPLAEIGTIHTFCGRVIRENFGLAGVPADFSVMEEEGAAILQTRAMTETMEDLFDESAREGDDGITFICDVIGTTRDPNDAAAAMLNIFKTLRQTGDDEKKLVENAELLEENAGKDFLSTPWGEAILDTVTAMTDHYISVFADLADSLCETGEPWEQRGPAVRAMLDYFRSLREALAEKDHDRTRDLLRSVPSPSTGRLKAEDKTPDSELVPDILKDSRKNVDACCDNYFTASQEQITDSMKRTARVLRAVSRALGLFGKKYASLKLRQGKLDFQDLETVAHRLLVGEDGEPTEAALRIGRKYKYIFIDEYQDTNSQQDDIFRAVGTEAERFLVGDVKQSVYRFRGAEPEIFSTYRRKWPAVPTADGDGDDICEPRDAGVFMSDNFRCSRPVVRFVNRVSDYMFRDGEVPFCEEDMLHAATASEVEDPVEVKILFSGKTKVKSPSEEDYVADRIKEMLGTAPFGEKPLKPSDFAIILRKAKDKVEGFVNALKARGIPVSDSAGVSLSDRPEVEFALDLLRAVDNPHRDVPLANVMMSSLFSFSLDEMTTVRLKYRDGSLFSSVLLMSEDGEGDLSAKCAAFCARMRYFREMERSLGAAVFIERLFEETGIVRSPEVRGVIDGDKHLRAVLDMARDYEKNSWGGLYGFLCRVEDKKLGGGLKSALGGSEGVSVITVHGSKGLEWPVCFFCGTGRAVDSTAGYDIVHGKELGWAMRLPDPGGLIKYVTPLMKAIDAGDHVGERYEEMRLIYVAMTRAVNKLIVVARSTRSENKLMQSADLAARFRDRHTMMTLPAEIDYILASLEGWRDGCYTLDTVVLPDEEDGPAEEETAAAAEETPSADPEKVAALVDSAEKRFAAQYPYSFLSGIPSKLSVSRLYPDVLSPEDGVADLEEEEEEEKRDGPMPVPSFMTGSLPVTGRERGVATHGFLQFADFARLGTCRTEDEIARLTENGFISERDAGLVSVPDVEKFKKSPLFRRIAGARRVWREFRFNVLLPAEKFTSDPERAAKFAAEDVKITVQGVFDCVFEDADGKLVVADYKTDYMSREDRADPGAWVAKLRERHALQLRYYREAATLLFGREPDEVLIYALALGDTVDMKDA